MIRTIIAIVRIPGGTALAGAASDQNDHGESSKTCQLERQYDVSLVLSKLVVKGVGATAICAASDSN